MKDISITRLKDGFKLTNNDTTRRINTICLKNFGSTYNISISLNNETPEEQSVFRAVENSQKLPLNKEGLILADATDVRTLIDIIHQIDSLPQDSLSHFKDWGVDVKDLLDKFITSVQNDPIAAIAEAIKSSEMKDCDKIIKLINYFKDHNDLINWLKALEAVPSDNSHFISAQETLFSYYMSLNNPNTLEKKFKHAYLAKLPEADLLYAQLAGKDCFEPFINLSSGAEPDMLIKLASIIRNQNEEIKQLKKNLALQSGEKRKTSTSLVNHPKRLFNEENKENDKHSANQINTFPTKKW